MAKKNNPNNKKRLDMQTVDGPKTDQLAQWEKQDNTDARPDRVRYDSKKTDIEGQPKDFKKGK